MPLPRHHHRTSTSGSTSAPLPFVDHVRRLGALEDLLRRNGQRLTPHPWLIAFLSDAQVESVVGDELAALGPADLVRQGRWSSRPPTEEG